MNNGAERDNIRIRLEKQENIFARCMKMLEVRLQLLEERTKALENKEGVDNER